MSRSARSLFVFGIYVIAVGVAFIAAPDPLMRILRLPPATAGWARVVGLLAVVIGCYDVIAARAACLPYIRASVVVRFGFAGGTVLLVLFGEMPPTLLVLSATDVASAIWTAVTLR